MHVLLVLIVALSSLLGFSYAQESEKLMISVDFQTDKDSVTISGVVKNEKGNPIEGATVKFFSIVEEEETRSDPDGRFVYKLSSLPANNTLNISVKAEKEGYLAGYANTSFFVNGQKSETKNNENPRSTIKTTDKIQNDPIAFKILQNIEQEKQKEAERQKKLQAIKERQEYINKQREIARQDLLGDLQNMFVQFDPFRPENVFATFVSQFDSTIQSIYWAQFNFTQTKTQEGLAALQQVLDSGGTAQEARQAFYEKAATPQSEIYKLNEELNAKYAKNNTSTKED